MVAHIEETKHAQIFYFNNQKEHVTLTYLDRKGMINLHLLHLEYASSLKVYP
jgi:hypothetical protein